MFGIFLSRLAGLQSPVLEFDKNCTQNAYFLQKVDFCIFEPKNLEVIENSSKTPLISFSPLQCTYLGKNSFQYHLGLVRKKKLKSGYLELRFSVYDTETKNNHIQTLTVYLCPIKGR